LILQVESTLYFPDFNRNTFLFSLDDYSHSKINADNNNRKYSNDNTMRTIASENPLTTRSYHQSSSYETKYGSTTSNPNSFEREQDHSRESSPSTTTYRNRSPSPTTGYIASSATTRTTSSTYRAGSSRDSASPSAAYVPPFDYRNVRFFFPQL
jgi:hypothetical protein